MSTGLLIGKFYPPTEGHRYLIDFASRCVDHLVVLVCTLKREEIPGDLRFHMMNEIFRNHRNVQLIHVTDDAPQYPEEHPRFWEIWHNNIQRHIRQNVLKELSDIDYLFASEDYGRKLSEVIGAEFWPVDIDREVMPISATKVRSDIRGYWHYIPHEIRHHFVKMIHVIGPESTGKTMLSQHLNRYFSQSCLVPEYARGYLNIRKDHYPTYQDISKIGIGQYASMMSTYLRGMNPIVISDTDVFTTPLWSQMLFGNVPDDVKTYYKKYMEIVPAENRLVLLMQDNVPFVQDGQRYGGDKRQLSTEDFKDHLEEEEIEYSLIDAKDYYDRFDMSRDIVENFVKTAI